jgi:hypothetical protein
VLAEYRLIPPPEEPPPEDNGVGELACEVKHLCFLHLSFDIPYYQFTSDNLLSLLFEKSPLSLLTANSLNAI